MPSKGKLNKKAKAKILGQIPIVEEGLGLVNKSNGVDYSINYEKCGFQDELSTLPAFRVNVSKGEALLFQFYFIIEAEGSLKGWGSYELDLSKERLPLVRDFLDRINACGELHYEYDGKRLLCTKAVAAPTPDVVAEFCHYFIQSLKVTMPAVLGGDEAELDKIAAANLENEITCELGRGKSNILNVGKKAVPMLPSTLLDFAEQAGRLVPNAVLHRMNAPQTDGKNKPSVTITIPAAFKSGKKGDNIVVVIMEGLKPQQLQLQHLPVDFSKHEGKIWNLPFDVRDLVRKFLKMYNSLVLDVECMLLPNGNLDIAGFFPCENKKPEDLKRYILHFLQCIVFVEVRVREASMGNLKPIEDFLEQPSKN